MDVISIQINKLRKKGKEKRNLNERIYKKEKFEEREWKILKKVMKEKKEEK